MKINKIIILLLVCPLIFVVLSGCNQKEQKKIGPEVGKWHAEIKISDLIDSMSNEDKLLLSMLA